MDPTTPWKSNSSPLPTFLWPSHATANFWPSPSRTVDFRWDPCWPSFENLLFSLPTNVLGWRLQLNYVQHMVVHYQLLNLTIRSPHIYEDMTTLSTRVDTLQTWTKLYIYICLFNIQAVLILSTKANIAKHGIFMVQSLPFRFNSSNISQYQMGIAMNWCIDL